MAHLGHYISGAGHAGLIGFVLVGPLFSSEPLPFETINVSMVTAAEFATLTERPTPVALPQAPVVPDVPEDAAPVLDPATDTAPEDIAPPPPDPPTPEADLPEPPPPPVPLDLPQTNAPNLVTPSPIVPPDLPDLDTPAQQPPVERVAPTPVAPPPPDAEIAPETQEAIAPDPTEVPAETREEAQEATAPEEAASEIVTEAEEGPSSAPQSSLRPLSRPRQVADIAPETPEPSTEDRTETIEDALQQALGGATPTAPTGPPLTASERDGLVVAVQACWIIDPGSPAAEVVVTVAMSLTPEGRVEGDVRRVSAVGGDARAQDVAFQAARRAVLRCQSGGFPLPPEKYAQWQELEITFNPESMRIR